MKDALKEVHKKAAEIGHGGVKARIHTCASLGMDGFSRYPDPCSRKSFGPWGTANVGLPYNEESFREICRKRRLLEEQILWARLAVGVDECQETEERIDQYAKRLQRTQMESKDGVGKQKGFLT